MMKDSKIAKVSIISAMIAAIIGSVCCFGPLILIVFGISGAWIGMLTSLHFLRPYAAIVSVAFLSIVFWQLYIRAKPICLTEEETGIAVSRLKVYRVIFWASTILVLLLLAFPYYAQYFF